MKTNHIFSLLCRAFLFVHFITTPSAVDTLAFGFKDIFDTRKDCAGSQAIYFNQPQAIPVLQQSNSLECGFHALKNGVVFLDQPQSVYNKQELYLNEDRYEDYYQQWNYYKNKEGSIDQSINSCIEQELEDKESRIVVLSNVILNKGVVSFRGPIDMTESVKLFNLLERLNSEKPEDFVILLGVSKDYNEGHWRTLLVDATNKRIFFADSYVKNATDLTSDNRLLANYVKENILDKGACNYLQYYFNQYLEYLKNDVLTRFALEQAYNRIDKNLLQKLQATSPSLYAEFQKSIKELEKKLLKKE